MPTFDLLRGPSGVQWPCTAQAPGGIPRLYTDGAFRAAADDAETYGRDLYLRAADNSLAWEMLAQVAQAQKRRDLLELAGDCHARNLRQLTWANTMLKTQSPQILGSL